MNVTKKKLEHVKVILSTNEHIYVVFLLQFLRV